MVPRENLQLRPRRGRLPLLTALGLAAGLIALALMPLEAFACATPTIATKLSANPITVGATVHDSATLNGATPTAGGTVTYTVRTDAKCLIAWSKWTNDRKTVINGIVPDSASILLESPGTFYWQAAYSGDQGNNRVTSACSDEKLVVAKATGTVSTQATPTAGVVGTAGTFEDTATISSAFQPSGSVIFGLYANSSCTVGVDRVTGNGRIGAGGASFSTSWTPAAAGTYYWKVSYAGDQNNNGFTACGGANETVTVTAAPADGTQGTSVTTDPVGGVKAASVTVPTLPRAGHATAGVAMPNTGSALFGEISLSLLLVLTGLILAARVIFSTAGRAQD